MILSLLVCSMTALSAEEPQVEPKAASEGTSTATIIVKSSIGLVVLTGIGLLIGYSIHNFKSSSEAYHAHS
jgi:hypothetical protein